MKRGNCDEVLSSAAARELLGQVGRGASHVSDICAAAKALHSDGVNIGPLNDLASLGSHGQQPSNEETDLHHWMQGSFGVHCEVC